MLESAHDIMDVLHDARHEHIDGLLPGALGKALLRNVRDFLKDLLRDVWPRCAAQSFALLCGRCAPTGAPTKGSAI